jgi:pimeloyl-ACP methyl ester carboxylesterase
VRASDENHLGLAPVNSGSLYYDKTGNGPAVVLLHPGFSDARNWDLQVNSLSSKYTCIRYDQRGSGRSSLPSVPFSHVNDLFSLLEYLSIPKAHIIGHSVGAQIAIDFALEYPDRVDSLVLVGPGVTGYFWSDAFLAWIRSVYSDFTPEGITERTLSATFYAKAMQNVRLAKRLRMLTLHNVQKLLAWKCHDLSWPKPEATERLEQLRARVLVMLGSDDSKDIFDVTELLRSRIIDLNIHIFPGADHFPNLEYPDEFNERVLLFLSEVQTQIKNVG